MVAGHADGQGAPDTIIEWKTTSVPVFIFSNSVNSGMNNLHFRFTGVAPVHYPFGDVALLRGLGFNPTFPHTNQMSGGNYELASVIMLFGSEHCSFSAIWSSDSATHDNQHAFGFAMNFKGKGLALAGGTGGITGVAADNRVSGITIHDFVMGLMIAGQENLLIENVTADRRASSEAIAPGHLIYMTGTALFDAKGAVEKRTSSRNVTIRNIHEGAETYSNLQALGTLAIKSVDGGVFPDGGITASRGASFRHCSRTRISNSQDIQWISDKDYCAEGGQRYCATSVIESAASAEGDFPMQNLTFPQHSFGIGGARDFREPDGCGSYGRWDRDANEADVSKKIRLRQAPCSLCGTHRTPTSRTSRIFRVLTSFDHGAKYNQPFVCWGTCSNVHVDVTVKWPKALWVPSQSEKSDQPWLSGSQRRRCNNTATSHVEETAP